MQGYLEPVQGSLKIVPPKPGLIIERRVHEGDVVKKGDVMYVLSNERIINTDGTNIEEYTNILSQARAQESSLEADRIMQENLNDRQRRDLEQRTRALEDQLSELINQISIQRQYVESSKEQYRRFSKLTLEKFYSVAALQQKNENVLSQQEKLRELIRNKIALQSELSTSKNEIIMLPLKQKRSIESTAREIASLKREITQASAEREISVVAPIDGVVASLLGDPGQLATTQPLLTLLPTPVVLRVRMFVPDHSAGFIQVGQTVNVRFNSYPYQKFGQYRGTITQIGTAATSINEFPAWMQPNLVESDAKGFYQILVDLKDQSISTYGKSTPLKSGMQVSADILLDTRSLFEWIFEPLYALKGHAL